MKQLNIALNSTEKYNAFYFVEDDYLHRKNSAQILNKALQYFDYVTLYNHPDKWTMNNGAERLIEKRSIYRVKNDLFFDVRSTTLTFACKRGSLLRDLRIWKMSRFFKGIPRDYLLWEVITSSYPMRGNFVPLILRRILWCLTYLRKSSVLSCPLPGYATHVEIKELDNTIDWNDTIH